MRAVIGVAINMHNPGMLLDQVNGREKAFALQAVLVEVIRSAVGRCDQCDAIVE